MSNLRLEYYRWYKRSPEAIYPEFPKQIYSGTRAYTVIFC